MNNMQLWLHHPNLLSSISKFFSSPKLIEFCFYLLLLSITMDNIPHLSPRRTVERTRSYPQEADASPGSVKRVIYCENDARGDVVDVAFKTAQKSVKAVTGEPQATMATELCTSTYLSSENMQRQNFTPSLHRPSWDVDPKKYDPGEKTPMDTSGMKFMKFEKGYGPEMENGTHFGLLSVANLLTGPIR
jgi:hypothetical protein